MEMCQYALSALAFRAFAQESNSSALEYLSELSKRAQGLEELGLRIAILVVELTFGHLYTRYNSHKNIRKSRLWPLDNISDLRVYEPELVFVCGTRRRNQSLYGRCHVALWPRASHLLQHYCHGGRLEWQRLRLGSSHLPRRGGKSDPFNIWVRGTSQAKHTQYRRQRSISRNYFSFCALEPDIWL